MRKNRPHCITHLFKNGSSSNMYATFYEPGVYYLIVQGFVADFIKSNTDYYLDIKCIVPPSMQVHDLNNEYDSELHPQYATGMLDQTSRVYKVVCTGANQTVDILTSLNQACMLISVLHNNQTEPLLYAS